MKIDSILAVKNVVESAKWYQSVFNWSSNHGGDEFDVLIAEDNEIMICLHKWGAHEHPTMSSSNITPGNGLILYLRTKNIDEIYSNLEKMKYPTESEIAVSPNSKMREFSLRDPDGYFITIAEFHTFGG